MTRPTVFADRYQVIRPVARGGMAEVFLATDTRLDRPIAIKVLHEEFAGNASFLQRFDREARATAAFNHPNMVQVYDYGRENGSPFLVMEYVRGKTLRELLREQGVPPPERAAEVMADVSGALQYAHEHGIVHRDVKPGNIMIDVDGMVKVADFGIAQAKDDDVQVTQVGTVVGTAAYLSPEQAQGRAADARSDVYAMGCVLYELLCGQPPFDGETSWAIAYHHVNDEPAPPSQVRPGVPRGLEQIALMAMAKDPSRRYQSAAAMRADLHRYRRGETPQAAGGATRSGGYTASMYGTGTAMGAMTSVAAVATPARPVPASAPPPYGRSGAALTPVARDVPEKRKRWPAVIGLLLVLAAILGGAYLIYLGLFSSDRVAVPSVANLTAEQATGVLRQAGFAVDTQPQPSSTVPTGKVVNTKPSAGTQVERGATVTLVVSGGPASLDVPDVVGKSQQDATTAITSAGFQVDVQKETSSLPEGAVTRQDPAGGTKAASGSTITIGVSSGPALVDVPNVEGLTQDKAQQTLRGAGFSVTVVTAESDQVEGTVTDQTPGAGNRAPQGTAVTITVSTGRTVIVPDVTGKSPTDAANALGLAGLTSQAQDVPSQPGCDVGKVCTQSPAGGTRAKKGDAVKLFVGAPPPTTTTVTTLVPPTVT